MSRQYRERIAQSKARLDVELRNVVKKIAHHSRADIKEYIRQRCSVAITDEYLDQLLRESSQ